MPRPVMRGPPRLTVAECLHDTLTLDPGVALLGLSFPDEQEAAFVATRSFRLLAANRIDDIRRRAAEGQGAVLVEPRSRRVRSGRRQVMLPSGSFSAWKSW